MNADSLIRLDQELTLWLNGLGSPAWDPFWGFMSDTKVWFPAYGIFMVWAIWRLGWKKGLAVVLSIVLTIVLADQLSGLVKAGFERLRPCYNSWMLENGLRLPYGTTGHLYGFFSSHASNTFGFAVVSYLGLRLNDPKRSYRAYGWGVFLWATLVTLSRVMMAAHFLGDVLVGTLFGLLVGFTVAGVTRWVIVKAKL